jgi:hypothetical protein
MYQPFISTLYSATLRLVSPVLLIPGTYIAIGLRICDYSSLCNSLPLFKI